MDKKTISTMKKMFDDIMHTTEDETVEFWYARELMGCLGYTTWRRFKDAINRAIESCKSAEIEVSDHFADAVKMVEIGSNAVRDVDDIMLTRYACYFIAQKFTICHRMHLNILKNKNRQSRLPVSHKSW